jgi:hypothetical protein
MAMSPLIPVLVSSALLAASPLEGLQSDETTIPPAQAFSAAAGILGAATACDEIARDQLAATARQIGTLAEVKASDPGELVSIRRLLIISAAAGRKALQEGKTDCKTVEASFDALQQADLQVEISYRRD